MSASGSRPASATRPAAARVEEVDIDDEFREAALAVIDAAAVKPLKVVVDGGNGMAGPMVGPLLERLGLELVEAYWKPDGNFPDHEPNPMLPENREFIMREVVEKGADLGIAWDGDADRCFFIDETGAFVDGDFLTALLADSMLRKQPQRDDPLRRPGEPRRRRHGRAGRRPGADEPGRARVLQDPDARGERGVRRRGLRPLLLPRLLLRGLGHDPGAADPRAALAPRARRCPSCSSPTARKYFISGEINTEVSDQDAKLEELAERYADGHQYHLDGLSVDYDDWHFNVRPSNTEPLLRLCLESLALARGHGAPARRGARRDPFVSATEPAPTTAAPPSRSRSPRAPGSTGSPSRRRSSSAGSTAT